MPNNERTPIPLFRVRCTDTKCVCTCSKFQEWTDKSSNGSHCYNGLH